MFSLNFQGGQNMSLEYFTLSITLKQVELKEVKNDENNQKLRVQI
jgi:hypothetical protein